MDHENLRQHIGSHRSMKAGHAIALIWTIHDILEMEGPNGDPHGLSEEEAIRILRQIEENHDANHGISWDHLEYAIHDHLLDNPRHTLRGAVAIGRPYGGGEGGTWDTMTVDLIAEPLDGKSDLEIAEAFEQETIDILNARSEEAAFVQLLYYERVQPGEDEAEEEEALATHA